MNVEIKERIEQVHRGEVPEGYRNQWHIAPQEWGVFELNKLCKKSIEKNKNNRLMNVLTNSAIYGIVPQGVYFKKDIANEENTSGYYVVNEGDYVYNPRISINAPFGPINRNDTGVNGIVSPLYTVFRQRKGSAHYDYLRYYFASSEWHKYVYSIANYGVRFDRMNITDVDFMRMPISLPPTTEQKKIAEILTHCDKFIELEKQLIEEKRRQRKWLMQNLLDPDSGVRLPRFEGEWKIYKLGDICKTYSGGTPDRSVPEYYGGKINWIKSGELNSRYVLEAEETITEAGLKNSSAKMVSSGTILMALYGATAGVIAISRICAAINQAVLAIIPNSQIETNFLMISLENQISIAVNKYTQGGQPNFNAGIIRDLVIAMPTHTEQTAIANVISVANHEIDLLEQELTLWQVKKKYLMQLLLTGLVRVNV